MAHDLVVGAEAPPQARIIPPALPLLDKPLGPLKFLQVTFRNNLATAATETYEQLFHRGRVLGRDYVLANEPSAARHIFGAGAASYRRPVASLRIIRPIAGAGVLTAEGAGLATAEANPRAGAPKYSRTPARQAARSCFVRSRIVGSVQRDDHCVIRPERSLNKTVTVPSGFQSFG